MCVFTISIIKCILNSVRLLCVCFVWNVWELSKWWMQVECYCYGTFHSFFPLQFYHSICSKPRQNGMLLISFDLILMRFVQNEISLKHVLIESKCQKREQNNATNENMLKITLICAISKDSIGESFSVLFFSCLSFRWKKISESAYGIVNPMRLFLKYSFFHLEFRRFTCSNCSLMNVKFIHWTNRSVW